MAGHFVIFRSSRIHYLSWGSGTRLLFAFHGYGESAESFAFLESSLGRDFTIVAFDMPFHGKTEWKEELVFHPRDLLALMTDIATGFTHRMPVSSDLASAFPDHEPTSPIHASASPGRTPLQWDLLGYSMGGRVALQILGLVPQRIGRLVLLAPDGLFVNPWYALATRTAAGNRFFRWTMKKPGWLFLLMRTGNRLGLVNPSLYKFAAHYIDDDAVRQALYTRWTVMRGFRPRLRLIAGLVREQEIPVVLFYGSYDRIIRSRRAEPFLRRITPFGRLELLPAGHALLQPKFMEVIANALYLPVT